MPDLEQMFPLVIPEGIGGDDALERGYRAVNKAQRASDLRRVAEMLESILVDRYRDAGDVLGDMKALTAGLRAMSEAPDA